MSRPIWQGSRRSTSEQLTAWQKQRQKQLCPLRHHSPRKSQIWLCSKWPICWKQLHPRSSIRCTSFATGPNTNSGMEC
eukprot:12933145-Prorocentrum_lima.AAC.1